jgi:hypothetical protein
MVDWIGRPAMQTCTNFTWDYCQPIVKNAVRCGVCGAAADRYCNRFQCQDNYNHVGDLNVGIFADLTAPGDLVAM